MLCFDEATAFRPCEAHFWRDSADHEVDCLIEFGKKLVAVEVKAGRTMNDWFFKGISDWNKIAGEKQGNGFVIYGGSTQQAKTRSNILSWQSIDEIFASL